MVCEAKQQHQPIPLPCVWPLLDTWCVFDRIASVAMFYSRRLTHLVLLLLQLLPLLLLLQVEQPELERAGVEPGADGQPARPRQRSAPCGG